MEKGAKREGERNLKIVDCEATMLKMEDAEKRLLP